MTLTYLDGKILVAIVGQRLPSDTAARQARSELTLRIRRAARLEVPPADLVTMNSLTLVRELPSGAISCVALVFPWEADIGTHRISVFSPLGAALLGRRQGDSVAYRDRRQVRRFRIEEVVLQPEAAVATARAGK